ncbi:putative murein hydrolase (TIGR00659 family) [Metabacillus crassostreae]|uniref:LrgB family protein n=1 Tax=Metabacillus crassostreae TaxID=929098 RepID=UPI00195E15FD|nr:LrgB family protein [Metabacillus crassostreae]MBM7606128.1 putative murein hydrolase (TIGR00659 family) [Metabacillus crassostreae]
MKIILGIFFIIMTISLYALMKKVYVHFKYPILVPIFTASFIAVCFLLTLKIPYTSYMYGGKWIDGLLGPAVVALAIPLYDHRKLIKSNVVNIFISVFIGSLIGVISGVILSVIVGVNKELLYSIAPKSVTTPIAMEISELLGGTPAMAAVYVMVAGISGAVMGPFVLKTLKIKNSISKGIGFGTASHGIGTARALEMGSVEGAVSSIALTISAIFTSVLCPVILSFIN